MHRRAAAPKIRPYLIESGAEAEGRPDATEVVVVGALAAAAAQAARVSAVVTHVGLPKDDNMCSPIEERIFNLLPPFKKIVTNKLTNRPTEGVKILKK